MSSFPARSPANSRGFSLIEILMALTIFALVAVFATQGFYLVAEMEHRDRERNRPEQQLFRAWSIISQDLLHLRARPVRNQFGDRAGAYIAGRNPYLVEFTRGGLPTLSGSAGGMMRIAYQLDDQGRLLRLTWPALDVPQPTEPDRLVVLEGVSSARFEQLSVDNNFIAVWPPLNIPGDTAELMPRMIRVVLQTSDGMEMNRLLPGIATLTALNPDPPEGDPE